MQNARNSFDLDSDFSLAQRQFPARPVETTKSFSHILARTNLLNIHDAAFSQEKIVAGICDILLAARHLTLTNFGTFEIKDYATRLGRNPHAGVPMQIPAGVRLHFSSGKAFKEFLNQSELIDIDEVQSKVGGRFAAPFGVAHASLREEILERVHKQSTACRSDLVKLLAHSGFASKRNANAAISIFEVLIKNQLHEQRHLLISGLGTFRIKPSALKMGRNPRSGEAMQVGGGARTAFTASAQFKSRMRALSQLQQHTTESVGEMLPNPDDQL